MSELNIKVRKSQDNGSTFRATPDTLYMGGVGSAKVDTLHFEVPEEWASCAITLHVQRLSGALPDPQMLDKNNCVVVDRRWTQEKQGSWMLLAVDENGYIAMTKPGKYTCYETIDTNSTTETITPSVYEQFVAAVEKWGQTAVDAAAKAKSSEENAAGSASASADSAAAAARSQSAAAWRATKAADSASAADRAKTDAQTAAQQAEASAKKAGKALSDTITAKEDALKAIGDKQTTATQAVDTARDKALQQVKVSTEAAQTAATQAVDTVRDKALQQVKASTEAAQIAATQAVDTARDKALQQVEASTEAAKTAASEAAASAGNADQSAQKAAGSLRELKDGIATGDFKGEPGEDGQSPAVTVTPIANGNRVSITDKDGTKTIDVLNGTDGKDGTQIDDTTVTDSAPWSSKHIVDMLCPLLEETGNPVQCYPVAGYSMGVKANWEPVQEGSGTPYPAGGGPNLLDISQCTATVGKPYGLTITIDGDVFKVSGVPSSEVTVEDQYSFAVASCAQTELRGNGYKITPFALKGDVSSAWGLRTEDENSLAISAKLTPGVNTDIQLRLMVSKDTPAAYAPYENIRPIKGRDSVTVERCGENLIKFPYFTSAANRNGLVITSQQDGSITVDGTATADTWHAINFALENRLPMNTPLSLSGCPAGGSTRNSYYIGLYLGGKWFSDIGTGNTDIKFTTREISSRVEVSILKGTVCNDLTFYPKIEVGTTITPYSKYTGQTATLTLPRTIYGGTVDAVTGDGQETWKLVTLDGTEEWRYESDSYFVGHNILNNSPTETDGKCSHFIYHFNYGGDNIFCTGDSVYTGPKLTEKYTDVDEWKSYLAAQYAAGTPVQIAYKLAEPVPFTATGAQPIPALSGVNTVITDADSATVTGRADPIKRIIDLEDAVASMTTT